MELPGNGKGSFWSNNQVNGYIISAVKNPPAMQEMWAQSLGWEDPLEKKMATHSSILAWKNPIDRGAWRATVYEVAKSQT